MEMDTSSKNAGTSKDLRTAFKVVCDVNSLCRHIRVKYVKIVVAFTTFFHYTNQGFAPHVLNRAISHHNP